MNKNNQELHLCRNKRQQRVQTANSISKQEDRNKTSKWKLNLATCNWLLGAAVAGCSLLYVAANYRLLAVCRSCLHACSCNVVVHCLHSCPSLAANVHAPQNSKQPPAAPSIASILINKLPMWNSKQAASN